MKSGTYVKYSFMVWIGTNFFGWLIYLVVESLAVSPWGALSLASTVGAFSLVFSSPAILFLIPNMRVLASLPTRQYRIAYAMISILILCVVIAAIFLLILSLFGIPILPAIWNALMIPLLPFVIGAEVSFLLITRKIIFEVTAPSEYFKDSRL